MASRMQAPVETASRNSRSGAIFKSRATWPRFRPISRAPARSDHRSPTTTYKNLLVLMKLMVAAEGWDAAVLTASAWLWGSDVAWMLAKPSQWQLRWLLVLPLQSASALVSLRLRPPKYQRDPIHTRYSADPHRRIKSKRCEQPTCLWYRGSPEAGVADWH